MWISNRSVGFFPTLNYDHLIYAPFAEYSMLNLDLLFGGDRLVNLVQWFAYFGTCVAVSLIARCLGGSRGAQLLAAIACATVPVILLQASGAKNDLVVTFWISSAVYFLLEFGKAATWVNLGAFGAAVSLAIFTKGTAYAFLPPLVAAGWFAAFPYAKRRFIIGLPLVVLLVLAVNGPLFLKNYRMTGVFTGVGSKDQVEWLNYANRNHSVAGVAANAIRNVALQINLPSSLNDTFQRVVVRTIRLLGQDPDDPRALKLVQVMGMTFQTNSLSAREDMAGAPIHLLLFVFLLVLLALHWRELPDVVWYALGVVGSFALYCYLLRWERWNVRYQMPVTALSCVVIGLMIDKYFRRWSPAVGMVLLVAAAPFALRNEMRPLLPLKISLRMPFLSWSHDSILMQPRENFYFSDLRRDLQDSYVAAARSIQAQDCRDIGVDVSFEDVDYPLYALMDVNQDEPKVSYSGVFNQTTSYAPAHSLPPCAVVCFACAGVAEKQDQYRSIGGRFSTFGDLVVFSAAGETPNLAGRPDPESDLSDQELFEQVEQRLDAMKAMNSQLRYAQILRVAEQAKYRWPDKAEDVEVRLESINSMKRDSFTTIFNTAPVRFKVMSNQPVSATEHSALVGAAEAMESLRQERMERLDDLGRFEDDLSKPDCASSKVRSDKERNSPDEREYNPRELVPTNGPLSYSR